MIVSDFDKIRKTKWRVPGIFLICGSLIFVLPLRASAEVELPKLVKQVQPAIVTIFTYDKDKNALKQGSGFFINSDCHLITNYHVLEGAYSTEVKTYDGKKYPVRSVVTKNKDMDLIQLEVDIPKNAMRYIQVIDTTPDIAERILVIGSPLGLEQTVSEGIISAVRDIPDLGTIYQMSAPISSGSSGSPVVNMKGQVVGVATLRMIEGQNLNFAVSGKEVLNLKVKKQGKAPPAKSYSVTQLKISEAETLYALGLSSLWINDYEKALKDFQKCISNDPYYSDAWFYIGVCYSKLNQYQKAIEAYKKAIEINPSHDRAFCNLGVSYGDLGRHQEAIEALKQSLFVNFDNAKAHYFLGVFYFKVGKKEFALDECRNLKKLDKKLADELFDMIYQ